MTKYVKTKTVPEDLQKDEYVIPAPNFIEEIKQCSARAPKSKLLFPFISI